MNEVKVILELSPETAALIRGLLPQAVAQPGQPATLPPVDTSGLSPSVQKALQPAGPLLVPTAPTPVDMTGLSPSVQQALQPSTPAGAPTAPVAPVTAPAAPTTPAPTNERAYTMEELSKAGAELMDANKGAEARAILAQFGVTALQDLPAAQYGALAMAFRAAGAKI